MVQEGHQAPLAGPSALAGAMMTPASSGQWTPLPHTQVSDITSARRNGAASAHSVLPTTATISATCPARPAGHCACCRCERVQRLRPGTADHTRTAILVPGACNTTHTPASDPQVPHWYTPSPFQHFLLYCSITRTILPLQSIPATLTPSPPPPPPSLPRPRPPPLAPAPAPVPAPPPLTPHCLPPPAP